MAFLVELASLRRVMVQVAVHGIPDSNAVCPLVDVCVRFTTRGVEIFHTKRTGSFHISGTTSVIQVKRNLKSNYDFQQAVACRNISINLLVLAFRA